MPTAAPFVFDCLVALRRPPPHLRAHVEGTERRAFFFKAHTKYETQQSGPRGEWLIYLAPVAHPAGSVPPRAVNADAFVGALTGQRNLLARATRMLLAKIEPGKRGAGFRYKRTVNEEIVTRGSKVVRGIAAPARPIAGGAGAVGGGTAPPAAPEEGPLDTEDFPALPPLPPFPDLPRENVPLPVPVPVPPPPSAPSTQPPLSRYRQRQLAAMKSSGAYSTRALLPDTGFVGDIHVDLCAPIEAIPERVRRRLATDAELFAGNPSANVFRSAAAAVRLLAAVRPSLTNAVDGGGAEGAAGQAAGGKQRKLRLKGFIRGSVVQVTIPGAGEPVFHSIQDDAEITPITTFIRAFQKGGGIMDGYSREIVILRCDENNGAFFPEVTLESFRDKHRLLNRRARPPPKERKEGGGGGRKRKASTSAPGSDGSGGEGAGPGVAGAGDDRGAGPVPPLPEVPLGLALGLQGLQATLSGVMRGMDQGAFDDLPTLPPLEMMSHWH